MNTTNILRTAERKKINLEDEFKNLSATNYTTSISNTISILERQVDNIVSEGKKLEDEIKHTRINIIDIIMKDITGRIQSDDRENFGMYVRRCEEFQKEKQKQLDEVASIYFKTSFFIYSGLGCSAILLWLAGVFH